MGLFDLNDRIAVLTGASKGMGLAMANALADHGARVVISSRKIDQCEEACAAIDSRHGKGRATAIACNIGYKEQLQALVREGVIQTVGALSEDFIGVPLVSDGRTVGLIAVQSGPVYFGAGLTVSKHSVQHQPRPRLAVSRDRALE